RDLDVRNLLAPALETGNRPSRGQPHLESTLDAVPVRGGDPSTTLRVDFRQPTMEPLRAAGPLGDATDARADLRLPPRHLRKAAQEGAQIEKRAADENRPPPPRHNRVAALPRQACEIRRVKL